MSASVVERGGDEEEERYKKRDLKKMENEMYNMR
jgi:hypothetical protein